MTDRFAIFNKTAKSILDQPDLDYNELIQMFKDIEALVMQGISVIVRNSTFVEDNICFILYRIACGAVKNEKYKTYDQEEKSVIKKLTDDVTIGSGNLHILSIGKDLFRLSKTERTKAVPDIFKIFKKLHLRTNRYEAILRTFNIITKDYCDIELDLVRLKTEVNNLSSNPTEENKQKIIQLLKDISILTDKKRLIEQKVGAVYPNYLYGVVSIIDNINNRIKTIQNKIVKSYMKLVVMEVRKYAHSDLHATDMLQAGSFGLWRAVTDYDYRQRMSFPTFARNWVVQRIQVYRKESGGPLIRIPSSTWRMYQQIQSVANRLSTELNIFDPNENMLADELGWPIEKVESVLQLVQTSQVISYDQDQKEDAEWKETTVYAQEDMMLTEEEPEYDKDFIFSLLSGLTKEERMVVCLKTGLLEAITNDDLDMTEVLNEYMKQITYKLTLSKITNESFDTV